MLIIHFLKIDVEGAEESVLEGLPLDVIRPWIILFESVAPMKNDEDVSVDCVKYLESKKYHQVYFDGLNKFFVADEHTELDKAFSVPVNIFDSGSLSLNHKHFLSTSLADQRIRKEIKFIKSSKFWKLREKYIALKRLLILH